MHLLGTNNKTSQPGASSNLNILRWELAKIILPRRITLMQSHSYRSTYCKPTIIPTRIQNLLPWWYRPKTIYQKRVNSIQRPYRLDKLSRKQIFERLHQSFRMSWRNQNDGPEKQRVGLMQDVYRHSRVQDWEMDKVMCRKTRYLLLEFFWYEEGGERTSGIE